jgi:hypothetical protein
MELAVASEEEESDLEILGESGESGDSSDSGGSEAGSSSEEDDDDDEEEGGEKAPAAAAAPLGWCGWEPTDEHIARTMKSLFGFTAFREGQLWAVRRGRAVVEMLVCRTKPFDRETLFPGYLSTDSAAYCGFSSTAISLSYTPGFSLDTHNTHPPPLPPPSAPGRAFAAGGADGWRQVAVLPAGRGPQPARRARGGHLAPHLAHAGSAGTPPRAGGADDLVLHTKRLCKIYLLDVVMHTRAVQL